MPLRDIEDVEQEALLRYLEAAGGRRPRLIGNVKEYVSAWTRTVVQSCRRALARDAMGHVCGRMRCEAEAEAPEEVEP